MPLNMIERFKPGLFLLTRLAGGAEAPPQSDDDDTCVRSAEQWTASEGRAPHRHSRRASLVPLTPAHKLPPPPGMLTPAPLPVQAKVLAGLYSEFVSFGFVPNCPVLWTSALAATPRDKQWVDRIRFHDLQRHLSDAHACQVLGRLFPQYVSWWSRGLTFSANGRTAAYTLPPTAKKAASVTVLRLFTEPLAGQSLAVAPLTRKSDPVQISPDGALFCHLSARGREIYVSDAMQAPLVTVPGDGNDCEVLLCNAHRFYVATRDRRQHTTSVHYFAYGPAGLACLGGRNFLGERWRLSAGVRQGTLTLLDSESDQLCHVDLVRDKAHIFSFAEASSDAFSAVCSPDGQYVAWQSKDGEGPMCVQRIDADEQWHDVIRTGGRQQKWQSACFSADVTTAAFSYFQEPCAEDERRGSGCVVYDLRDRSRSPFSCFYDNTEIRQTQLSPNGRQLALLVRQDFSYEREPNAYRLHVWSLHGHA